MLRTVMSLTAIPVYLAASVTTLVLLLPFERAAVGRLSDSEAIASIVSPQIIHLTMVAIVVVSSRASLAYFAAPGPAPSRRQVLTWACIAHVPFALWAILGFAMLSGVASETPTPHALDVLRQRLNLWEYGRSITWVGAALLFAWQAHRVTRIGMLAVSLQLFLPCVCLWIALEIVARIIG